MKIDKADAAELTRALGGRWYGRYGVAACPSCQPEGRRDQSALTVADGDGGRLLLHCKRAGCGFTDILAATGIGPADYRPPDPAELARRDAERKAAAAKRSAQARRCWEETLPIGGTAAEGYLRGRAITCDLPGTLRFHPACWHGATAKRWPAMVALVQGADGFAIHRTYLADVEPRKAMLGAVAGGAVRLSDGRLRLAVAEGIETALSLSCGLLDGPATVWAALSASGMKTFDLPRRSGRLTIAPDGDEAGRSAARVLAERASALGWRVELLTPPEGCDWNDVLRGEVGG